MKKNTKIIIVIGLVFTLYFGLVVLITNLASRDNKPLNPDKEKEPIKQPNVNIEKDYANVVLSPNTRILLENNTWSINKNKDYNKDKFEVYVNKELIGNYYLTYNKKWYFYDDNKNFIDYSGDVIAINSNLQHKIINFQNVELDINDQNIITTLLEEKNIMYNYDELKKEKIIFDINRDGLRDEIYFVSNAFSENTMNFNSYFSIGFVKFLNNTEVFYENIGKFSNVCLPSLQNLVEIDNELILIASCKYFSAQGTEHYVYSYSNNNFKEELKTSIENK